MITPTLSDAGLHPERRYARECLSMQSDAS
jgi:hypothetical protein